MKTDGKPSSAKKTIRSRKLWVMVLVPLFSVVLVVLAVMIAFNLQAQKTLVDKHVNDQNNLLAKVVKNSIFDALSTGDNDLVRSQFTRLREELPGVGIYVYDFRGVVSFSTDSTAIDKNMDQIVTAEQANRTIDTMLHDGETSTDTVDLNGDPYSLTHLPIANESSCHHCHGRTQAVLGGITVAANLAASVAAVKDTRNSSMLIGLAGLAILVSAIYVLFLFLVTKPVIKILAMAKKLRQGDFTHQEKTRRQDELAHILNRMNLVSTDMRSIFKGFTQKSDWLAEASERLANISASLKDEAQSTSQESNSVADASRDVSTTINSVSAAMEQTATNISQVTSRADELFNTITEIAQSSGKAQSVLDHAAASFKDVASVVQELGKAAREIDAVTDNIREVSEQVNLLALNATIEAARAGEAGRGFAVVAQEIKELAKQTAAATDDADAKLRWMQSKTRETIEKIDQIAGVMDDAHRSVNTIAAAVEEQSASTKEISMNMNQAAEGVAEVNDNIARTARSSEQVSGKIRRVDQSTHEIVGGSEKVNQQAAELSKMAEEIKTAVHRFTV